MEEQLTPEYLVLKKQPALVLPGTRDAIVSF